VGGEQQLAEQRLAEGMLADEPLKLTHELADPSEFELGFDARLDGEQPTLLQRLRLGRSERLVFEIRERASTPEIERLAEHIARLRRIAPRSRRASLLQQPLQAPQIKLTRLHPDHVAGGTALDPPTTQRSPQARDVTVERVRSTRRRRLTPQPVDQPIARNGSVRIQQKHRQDRALLRAAEREPTTVVSRLERTEDRELHPS